MVEAAEVKEQVRRYYQATTEDYLKYYQTDWHHHMHFGFDRDLPKGGNPTEHLVRYLAGLAGLIRTDNTVTAESLRVLDAGCGVGGSAIWLSRELGCRTVGITLVESQARLAGGFARRGQARNARFAVNDFQTPAFKAASFDVIWAVESFDHSPDKAQWIKAMAELLKPGGYLVIADGFEANPPRDAAQAKAYRHFLDGWAVPHLCTFAQLKTYGADAGLDLAHAEDLSSDVLPHSLAIFRFGLLFIPWRWLKRSLGFSSAEKLGNALATFYQYKTLKAGLWRYGAFCFRKPG